MYCRTNIKLRLLVLLNEGHQVAKITPYKIMLYKITTLHILHMLPLLHQLFGKAITYFGITVHFVYIMCSANKCPTVKTENATVNKQTKKNYQHKTCYIFILFSACLYEYNILIKTCHG